MGQPRSKLLLITAIAGLPICFTAFVDPLPKRLFVLTFVLYVVLKFSWFISADSTPNELCSRTALPSTCFALSDCISRDHLWLSVVRTRVPACVWRQWRRLAPQCVY